LGSHASLAESLANGTVPAKGNNFTQLQQHIDDLTKEKFELVRGLKEQQKMAGGLSEENLLLTEDFNRQVIADLSHLHNVETCFYCPQTFLSLDFQCRDDVLH